MDANKLIDLKNKLGRWPDFIRDLRRYDFEWETGKDLEIFVTKCSERLAMGSVKYGDSWKHVDLITEAEQEILDVPVYMFLHWLKLKENNALTPKKEIDLCAISFMAFMLWNAIRTERETLDRKD